MAADTTLTGRLILRSYLLCHFVRCYCNDKNNKPNKGKGLFYLTVCNFIGQDQETELVWHLVWVVDGRLHVQELWFHSPGSTEWGNVWAFHVLMLSLYSHHGLMMGVLSQKLNLVTPCKARPSDTMIELYLALIHRSLPMFYFSLQDTKPVRKYEQML